MFPWPLTMWFKADNGFKNILNTYKQVKTLKVLLQKASGIYQYTNIKYMIWYKYLTNMLRLVITK